MKRMHDLVANRSDFLYLETILEGASVGPQSCECACQQHEESGSVRGRGRHRFLFVEYAEVSVEFIVQRSIAFEGMLSFSLLSMMGSKVFDPRFLLSSSYARPPEPLAIPRTASRLAMSASLLSNTTGASSHPLPALLRHRNPPSLGRPVHDEAGRGGGCGNYYCSGLQAAGAAVGKSEAGMGIVQCGSGYGCLFALP